MRDAWLQLFVGGIAHVETSDDPALGWVARNGLVALGVVAVVIAVVIGGGWLSWRMHAYRLTDEVIEEREGVLFRRHRRARLDRVQGVQVERPLVARLFGLARIDVSAAGGEAGVRLAYLGSATADELRRRILAAAAGARAGAADPAPAASQAGLVERRLREFQAPELDVETTTPDSLVRLDLGRLVASTALRAVPALLAVAAVGVATAARGEPWWLLAVIPVGIAVAGWLARTVLRSLRYSIASTPHGIRVGSGLLSTVNETIAPGRIHALEARQPILWRPFGWWELRANVAFSSSEGGEHRVHSALLPVGSAAEVGRVLALVDPRAVAMLDAPITTTPARAGYLRPWSWRRNGIGLVDAGVVIRRGLLTRSAILVPLARVQSTAVSDGPLTRAAGVARIDVHTVPGLVAAHVGAIDRHEAAGIWFRLEAAAVGAMRSER